MEYLSVPREIRRKLEKRSPPKIIEMMQTLGFYMTVQINNSLRKCTVARACTCPQETVLHYEKVCEHAQYTEEGGALMFPDMFTYPRDTLNAPTDVPQPQEIQKCTAQTSTVTTQ
ncbi:hypothetical protein Pelo_9056 [Pelomyxa schiedti]|nr:hypothetical protein Pelo_9056 [Pelomyxa schiedti]